MGILMSAVLLFSACKEKEPQKIQKSTGDTYMTIALNLPNSTLRAGDESGKKVLDPKLYVGENLIENISVYVVDETNVFKTDLTKDDFDTKQADANTKEVKLVAKKAIETTAGKKKVYVLINGTQNLINALEATPSRAAFEQMYKKAVAFSAEIAQMDNTQSSVKSKVLMANSEKVQNGEIDVQKDVSEEEALKETGGKNKVTVEVARVAAVCFVTKAKNIMMAKKGTQEALYTVESMNYTAGLVEGSFYLTKNVDQSVFKSPNYDWNVAQGQFTKTGVEGKLLVSDLKTTDRTVEEVMGNRTTDGVGDAAFKGKNIFLSEMSRGDYKATNTTYIMVRAYLKPTDKMFADKTKSAEFTGKYGEVTADQIRADRNDVQDGLTKIQREYTFQSNGTFWVVGAGDKAGAVYASYANSQDPNKGGIKGQPVKAFVNGKAIYYVFPNPDIVADGYRGATKFPIGRNDIYHINILQLTELGLPWNNRYPDDPTTPENPDPSPNVGDETPVTPEDPVIESKTYLSVDINILPWNVYSHDIIL